MIYFVQTSCVINNEAYLPYASGMLAAYAWRNEKIRQEYCLGRFVYRNEPVADAVDSLHNPYLVAFSNYLWNYDYNLRFAAQLKIKYPECITVFGGHQVPGDHSWLEKYPFIDLLVHGEGEEIFCQLLLELSLDKDFKKIPNISFRRSDRLPTKTQSVELTDSLDHYPSPYLEGFFDDLVSDTTQKFATVLETNRGCPYRCLYCDWGNCAARQFSLDRIHREIRWISEHRISFLFCADSNFGFFERDMQIADWLVEAKKDTGFPGKFDMSSAKESNSRVYEINRKLINSGLGRGATLAFQSLTPAVLSVIGRKNIPPERFIELMAKYREAGISTHSDLILGLPGETYESFRDGIAQLLELGQHTMICTYYCELLTNAALSLPENIEKYAIQTITAPFTAKNGAPALESDGFSNIVVQTASMSREDWIAAAIFAVFIQCFHHFGLLLFPALYLYHEKKIGYAHFYEDVIEWARLHECSEIGKVYTKLNQIFRDIVYNEKGRWTYSDPRFGSVEWILSDAMFLLIASGSERFYDEIESFLMHYDINDDVFRELMMFQRNAVILPGEHIADIHFDYNWLSYFEQILNNTYSPLRREPITMQIRIPCLAGNWEDYGRNIVMDGRRNGGMILINNKDYYALAAG